jgi:hypothetical protein
MNDIKKNGEDFGTGIDMGTGNIVAARRVNKKSFILV